ncbi:hypothetical protein L1765_15130, partial [Microaerobacter geothermalis]|uniref:hypothetical protein n=1 Tax=Microaerobacter geothermalis TaxID=674972 RepID=UPI001F3FC1F2
LNQLFNDFVTLQLFFAQSYSLLSHSDIFTDALQYDNITDVQQKNGNFQLKIRIYEYNIFG